jgi:8-hydroxy-5-deazaflavin:NADPH oxidoreductase
MRIGIVGAGKVGGGLGKIWVRAGHQVSFSSRHPNRLKVLIEEAGPGAYRGTVADRLSSGPPGRSRIEVARLGLLQREQS